MSHNRLHNTFYNLHFDTEVDLDDSMNAEVDDLFTHSNANEDEVIDSSVLFSVIGPETYIGLRSPTSSLELFFVIKVVSKQIAEVNMVDTHGHAIIAGEAYVVGNYLEKKETKKHVEFKVAKNYQSAYIHLTEIFATNVEMSSALIMDVNEYQSLCQELY